MIKGLIKACRPKQWAKNVLVFVAPAAAGVLTEPYYLRLTIAGFVSFCLVSSATYLLNDTLDVESDRRHPTKCRRPIASGVVPIPLALVTAAVLAVAGCVLSIFISWQLLAVVAGYAVLTTCYSAFLKQVAILDLVILSAGFILRLLGGAYAAGVEVSEWFLLVSLFGSMFIASAKRYAEKRELGDRAAELRPTLGEYSYEFLALVRTAAVAAVTMSYCLWAVERAKLHGGEATPWIQLSIIPFVIAILRYALLVDQGHGSAPEEVFAEDRMMQVMGVALVIFLFLGLYV
ncbi:decaprenyl-phosphate phosphoribosyltransferase [Dermatobacter hominis]|uniref:decaprenyl-phosphate phosphoribosyltransferase n=1 Tax=Dermatobacter hominis TaxID=2884263 RepID=UPI0035ABD7FF